MAKRPIVSHEEEQALEMKENEREVVDKEAADDDDEEEDEEGQDEYEKDGFLVDDVEEEEEQEGEEEEEKKKKKKRKKRELEKNYVLDEDDYELLEDNNVSGFRRPKMGSKKFKRLKKAGRDTAQGEPSGFSDDEGPLMEDVVEEEERPNEDKGDIGEDDEMADFIVDEEEIGENVTLMRQRKLKKNKSRQVFGVSSSALEDAHDIFGDVDELLRLRKKGLAQSGRSDDSGERRERRLEDEFDPSILAGKYLTEKDNHIREIDVPERIQVSEESTGPPPVDEVSIRAESSWILSQLATNMTWKIVTGGTNEGSDLSKEINKEDIVRFLSLLHVEKYDVPFIAMYRKEHCPSLLKDPELEGAENEDKDTTERTGRLKWHRLLWVIKDLDRKWLLLQKRKSALQLYYNKRYEEESRGIIGGARLTLSRQLFKSITKSLKLVESEREVDDVDLKFKLHLPPSEMGVDEGQFKRPRRKSPYTICSKAGLWEVAGKFGCNAEQFGKLITLEDVRMSMSALEDSKETPEEIASKFTCSMFETPQAVLKGARHMAAVEISCEPRIRKQVRSIFMDKAVVSTSPTPKGNVAIDSFHPFAAVKCLRDKPLFRFEDAQWLLIQKAEEEKLLQVSLKLPKDPLNNLISEFNEYYLSDGVSKCAQLWNEQRKLILQDAIFNCLLPSMEKEFRTQLTSRAKNWLCMEYGKQFWNKISVAPYCLKEKDADPDEETPPRIMACCWGPGKPATTFVMLDSSGEVLDVLHAGSLSLRSQNENDQQRKKNDQQCVLKFMTDHQPHVVILGAVSLSCTRLKEDIYEIIYKMVEENPRDISQEMDGISIVYGDESLPHLYEHSSISSDQLPGKSGIVKRAVALGRYLQNPLAMVATLCGAGREIVSWKLGSLEHFLTPDEKYEMVEQLMVDVTNQVGVDINLAAGHDWLSSPLQFVSGFGPRKAAFLQRSLVRAGEVTNRKELTGHGQRTKKVFFNAIGFLRVRCSGMLTTGGDINLLDDTRIHPESYGLAEVLAKDVYKYYVQDDSNSDSVQELAIEYVKDHPELLKGLDIDQYAEDYEKENGENKRETLYQIKTELLHGFKDWRKPYQEPSQDEEFYMISGENGDTLAEGRIVHARVCRVQPQQAICVLDSGLTGILLKNDISDQIDDVDLTEKLHKGDLLACKIKLIQLSRYQVILSCKESVLKSNQYQNFSDIDPYYCEDQSSLLSEEEKTRKEEIKKKNFKPRMIVHPHFQNLTLDEAMEFLSDKDDGESIIRPSSRGPSYLTLTLKIYDGVYAHKDIIEGGKDNRDVTSFLSLGKTLKIGDDNFEDLDEVMDRYVDPLVSHLKAMLSYRKFRRGSKGEVDELLRTEKSDYPKRIVYCFGISYEHPGSFILSYIRSTNPHHEYVGLYPKGFKFRKHTFDNIDLLVAYFQKHIDELQHDVTQSFRSISAMVPMKSLASKDKNDFKNGGGGGGDGHPVGLPRPYGGRGCGHSHGSYNGSGYNSSNEKRDSGYDTTSKWGLDSKDRGGDDHGWSNFSGAKVQNTPDREAFPGGWGSRGSGGAGGGSWVGGNNTSAWGGSSWGQGTSGGNWGGDRRGGGSATGNFWGGRSVQSCGNNRGDNSENEGRNFGYGTSKWGLISKDGVGGVDGWSNFPGGKIHNTPGREAFPGRWGSSGSVSASSGGWGGNNPNGSPSTGNWCGGGVGGRSSGNSRGGSSGRGRGYGKGDTSNNEAFSGGWGSTASDRNWGSKGSTGGWGCSSGDENASWGSWGGKNANDSKLGVVSNDGWGGSGSGGEGGGGSSGNDGKENDGWGDKSSSGRGGQSGSGGNWGGSRSWAAAGGCGWAAAGINDGKWVGGWGDEQ